MSEGRDFATLAVLYSEDPGSAARGGDLGWSTKATFVPEFSAVAFNIQEKGKVSKIVETEFGFHIIQLIDRKGDRITVGIELDKALGNPGSEYDPILREGDRLFVPQLQNTVRISGNVLYPNTVTYVPGKPVSYYVSAAGGYGFRAKRSKTYIVYQNGTVSSNNPKVEPGCEIIVPEKPQREGLSATQIMSLTTSTASLAAVVVSIVNSLKK